MSEIWGAFNDCDDGIPPLWRIAVRLVVGYVMLAAATLAEYQFRTRGIELEARCEIVGETKGGGLRVRYYFNDPVTHRPRMNTVTVSEDQAPEGQTTLIEYIPGDMPGSRLKSQARPTIGWIFFWANVIALSGLTAFIGYIAWESRRPIPKSSQRRCPPMRSRR